MVKIVQINLGRRSLAAVGLYNLIDSSNYEIALIQEPYTFKKITSKLNKNGLIYENSRSNDEPRACVWINKDLSKSAEAIQLLEFSDKDCVAVRLKLNNIEGIRDVIICSAYFPEINEAGRNVVSANLNNLDFS
jgi:hypothetical protein